jgi:two-component system osmolarity sensor histidine kinase EnvZ
MATNLEGMERDRAMVLAGISHDLRTPLSRLRLALEMSGADPQTTDAMIADIDEIDAIIGQFLDFARGTDERKEANDLGALLGELAEHYARIGKDVRLVAHPVPPLPFARMAMRRAIANLIDNALRYAGEPVEVEAVVRADALAVEVRDQGPGIPSSQVERLKRPFTRLDDSRAGSGGAGLGLAIVERTALAHGGRLELLPRSPRGLIARLTLATR